MASFIYISCLLWETLIILGESARMVSTSSKVKFGLVNHQSYPEVQGGIPPLPPKCSRGYGQGQDAPTPFLQAAWQVWPIRPASLLLTPPILLSLSFFFCPSLHLLPCPTPVLSPTGKGSMSLPSWVTGALQLFTSLFGRTSQCFLRLLVQPTSHKASSVKAGGWLRFPYKNFARAIKSLS